MAPVANRPAPAGADQLSADRAEPVTGPRESRANGDGLSRAWVLLALVVVALAIAIVVRDAIYPAFSWNRDEVAYQWQVSVLRGREVFGSTGGFPEMFWPWRAGLADQGFFSPFTVGWPLVMLASDVVFETTAGAILVGVVVLVLGAYAFTREVARDHRLAVTATVLTIASPFFVVHSGVFLGYLFSTGLGLLVGASLFAGLRRDDWRLTALAGALAGYLFLTRPYDAVLWVAAVGVYAVVLSWRRPRLLVRSAVIAGVPFLVATLAALVYNRAVTGSFTQFPFTADEPLATFGFGPRGFGPRGLAPHTPVFDDTWTGALRGELRNAFALPNFLIGAWVGVAAALVGLWLRRRDRSTIALLAIVVVFPAGYAAFWGIRHSSFSASLSSPLLLMPLYVPICILIATVLLALWRHRRVVGVALCAALVVVTVPYLLDELRWNRAISRAQEPWRDSIARMPDPALVFVARSGAYLMSLNPFSRNEPDLGGQPLYATDRRRGMLELIAANPGRTPILQLTSRPALADAIHHREPEPPEIALIPLSVMTARELVVRTRVTATSTRPLVVSLRIGTVVDARVLDSTPNPGASYETEWRLTTGAPAPGELAIPSAQGDLTVRTAQPRALERPFAQRHRVQRFVYRPVAAGVELLTPSRQFAVRHVDGVRTVDEQVRLQGFDVGVVGTP